MMDDRTGAPFLDATMRDLARNGYVGNQQRRLVASYLVDNLAYPDWRAGEENFEYALIDHDVWSNWAKWATMATVGSVRRACSVDVQRQAKCYDPDGLVICCAVAPRPTYDADDDKSDEVDKR